MRAINSRSASCDVSPRTRSEVTDLRREARQLKEVVAEQTLELRLLKKACSRIGATNDEIPSRRETGNHPPDRAIPSAGTPNVGQARYPAREILPRVRSLPERRVGGAERQTTQAEAGLQPYPGRCSKAGLTTGPGSA